MSQLTYYCRRIEELNDLLDANNKHLDQMLKLGINISKKPQQIFGGERKTSTPSDRYERLFILL